MFAAPSIAEINRIKKIYNFMKKIFFIIGNINFFINYSYDKLIMFIACLCISELAVASTLPSESKVIGLLNLSDITPPAP